MWKDSKLVCLRTFQDVTDEIVVYNCGCYIGVIGYRKIESDRDYQKKRNVFKNLRFCGKEKIALYN